MFQEVSGMYILTWKYFSRCFGVETKLVNCSEYCDEHSLSDSIQQVLQIHVSVQYDLCDEVRTNCAVSAD